MKFKLRRILSILLVVFLMLASVPVGIITVQAEDAMVNSETELRDAVANAINGDTITVGSDIELTSGGGGNLTIAKSITLTSIGNHTITTGTNKIIIASDANAAADGNLSFQGTGNILSVFGIFTLAGSASVSSNASPVNVNPLGTLHIAGGTVTGSSGYGMSVFGTVGVTDGTVNSRDGLYVGEQGMADITGGTIYGTYCGIAVYNGTVSITGDASVTAGDGFHSIFVSSGILNVLSGISISSRIEGTESDPLRWVPFLNSIPEPVSMPISSSKTVTLDGVDTDVHFTVDSATSDGLSAAINGTGNAVTLNPTLAGSYSLVLSTEYVASNGNTSILNLNIPVKVTPAPPSISPNGGTFTGSTTVTLAGSNGIVYYTTDGSTPTTSSTPYTVPFTLSQSATVKAAVCNGSAGWSDIASSIFTISASPIPAPLVNTMTVNTTGRKLSIAFDKAMSDPSGKHGSFSVTADDQPVAVSAAAYGSDGNTIDLTLGQVYQGQTVKVAYSGASGEVTASDGGVLAVFTSNTYTVTNHSTVTIPPTVSNPPTWSAGSALTVSGTTKTKTTLSWTAAVDDAGVTGYRVYQDSSLIQTVTGAVYSYEVTGLSSSTTYTFQVRAGDVDDNWTYGPTVIVRTDASGGGGGGNSTPASTPEPKPTAQVLDSNGNISESVATNLDNSTGTAAVKINSASLTNAFDKSKADDKGIKTVEVNIPKIDGAKTYEPILPASFFASGDAAKAVKIKTDLAVVTVPSNMLTTANAAAAQNVSLTIAAVDKIKLDADLQAQIGSRPIIELNLKIDGKQTSWSNESASVTVTLPYMPTADELKDSEHITVWYIDGSGKAVAVPNGRYDPATGKVTFSTTHFSKYAIAFVQKNFDDLESTMWAKKQIEVLVSKGILKGISEKEYAPKTNITRADFVYSLVRTLGADAKVDVNFDDISSDAYYYKEIGIAKKLGITTGTGNSKFSPDANITRQDMMALTERALRMLKRLKQQGTASDLEKFADKSLIAAYAVDSVASVVKEGLIEGSGDQVNPLGNTTRAETAVFLYRIYNKY